MCYVFIYYGFNEWCRSSFKKWGNCKCFSQTIFGRTWTWAASNVGKGIKLYDIYSKKIGELYRVYSNGEQSGYMIVDNNYEVIEARFEGTDGYSEEKKKVYYEFPSKFHTVEQAREIAQKNKDNKEYGSGDGYITSIINRDAFGNPISELSTSIVYTINTSNVPDLDHKVEYSSSTMHYAYIIQDTPSYLNELLPGGCVPTATAMLVAYYDNEWHNDLSTLEGNDVGTPYGVWRPMFPMEAGVNVTFTDYTSQAVEDLIIELAIDMGSCNLDAFGNLSCGTRPQEFSLGLTGYLDTNNHDDYSAIISHINDGDTSTPNDFEEFKALVRTGNPSVLFINDPIYGGRHAVLGVGYTYHIGGNGVYILDDWDHGLTYYSTTNIEHFGFIYEN